MTGRKKGKRKTLTHTHTIYTNRTETNGRLDRKKKCNVRGEKTEGELSNEFAVEITRGGGS